MSASEVRQWEVVDLEYDETLSEHSTLAAARDQQGVEVAVHPEATGVIVIVDTEDER